MPKEQHGVKMFEVAVDGGVKCDDDGHAFAERKLRFPSSVSRYKLLMPKRFEISTKVVRVAEQFRKIHEYPLHSGFLA